MDTESSCALRSVVANGDYFLWIRWIFGRVVWSGTPVQVILARKMRVEELKCLTGYVLQRGQGTRILVSPMGVLGRGGIM